MERSNAFDQDDNIKPNIFEIVRRKNQLVTLTQTSYDDILDAPIKLVYSEEDGENCIDYFDMYHSDRSYSLELSNQCVGGDGENYCSHITVDPSNLDDTSEYCMRKYPDLPLDKKVLIIDSLLAGPNDRLLVPKNFDCDQFKVLRVQTRQLSDYWLKYCQDNNIGLIFRSWDQITNITNIYNVRSVETYNIGLLTSGFLDFSSIKELFLYYRVSRQQDFNIKLIDETFKQMTNLKKLAVNVEFFCSYASKMINANIEHLILDYCVDKIPSNLPDIIREMQSKGCLVESMVDEEFEDKVSDVVSVYDPTNNTYDVSELTTNQVITVTVESVNKLFIHLTSVTSKKSARK